MNTLNEGIESLPKTQIPISLQPNGVRTVYTFDISNLDYLILKYLCLKCLRSTTLGCKDIEIRKSVRGKNSISFYVNLNLDTQGVLV